MASGGEPLHIAFPERTAYRSNMNSPVRQAKDIAPGGADTGTKTLLVRQYPIVYESGEHWQNLIRFGLAFQLPGEVVSVEG